MLPDATRTAQSSMHRGSRTRCIPLASVMGIEPIGRWVWRPDRPPGRTLYDSFLGYQLGEPDPGADGRPLLTRSQRFRGRTNPDRLYFRTRLLLALKRSCSLSTAGSGLPGGLSQLLQLALVSLAGTGRLEGGLVFLACPRHEGFHPLPAAVAARRKELTPLSNHAFVRSMIKTRRHLRRLVGS